MTLASRYRNLEEPLQTERRVELVLLALVMLLVLQVLWGLYRTIMPPVPEPVLPTAEALVTQDLAAMQAIPAEARAGIRQRPLFWVTRRPLNAADEPVEALEAASSPGDKPQKIDGLKLAGVFGAGENAGIIVLAKDKKHRVSVGQEIKGWTLKSVSATEALFGSNGREARLALKRGKITFTEVPTSGEPAQEAAREEVPEAKPAARDKANGADSKRPPPANKRKRPPSSGSDSLSLGGGERGTQ